MLSWCVILWSTNPSMSISWFLISVVNSSWFHSALNVLTFMVDIFVTFLLFNILLLLWWVFLFVQLSMARPSGLKITLSFISVLIFAAIIRHVAGALNLVLFLLCVIVRFLFASTPGLANTPENAVPVLGS